MHNARCKKFESFAMCIVHCALLFGSIDSPGQCAAKEEEDECQGDIAVLYRKIG
jgi:hypothetical protein